MDKSGEEKEEGELNGESSMDAYKLGLYKTKRDGNRWEMGGRFKEEIYVHLWLIHVDV